MILLDGQVNGKPAVLLLDTGADLSIISPQAAGISAKLDALKATNTTGANGEYVRSRADLRLEKRHWIHCVKNLDRARGRVQGHHPCGQC